MKKQSISMTDFAMYGIGVGIPITLVCMTLIGGWNSIVREFLIWTVASALFGIISGLLRRNEQLPLPAAMALHCLACLAVAAGAGALCGYADSFWDLVLGILPVFVVVYLAVYALAIFAMKREELRINEILENT